MMKSATPWGERLRFRPLSVLGMTGVWVILWGSLSPLTLVSGIVLSWLVDAVFPLPPIHWEGRFHPIAFLVLVWHLLRDLVVSSMRLVRLVFARQVNLDPGIVRVDLHTDDDLYQVQVAILISLVPGTVVVEVVRHPRRLYLHALELVNDEAVEQIQQMAMAVESRVVRAFGSAEQIAAFDADCLSDPLSQASEMEGVT